MKKGLQTSELWVGIAAALTSVKTAMMDADPMVRTAGVVMVGLIAIAYLSSRARVKAAG